MCGILEFFALSNNFPWSWFKQHSHPVILTEDYGIKKWLSTLMYTPLLRFILTEWSKAFRVCLPFHSYCKVRSVCASLDFSTLSQTFFPWSLFGEAATYARFTGQQAKNVVNDAQAVGTCRRASVWIWTIYTALVPGAVTILKEVEILEGEAKLAEVGLTGCAMGSQDWSLVPSLFSTSCSSGGEQPPFNVLLSTLCSAQEHGTL